MEFTRVVIVDSSADYRQGLRRMLKGLPEVTVVAEATTTSDGLEQALHHRPEIILLEA